MGSDKNRYQARIAQMVEQRTANPYVAGSIPAPTRVLTPYDRTIDHLSGLREASRFQSGFLRAFRWDRKV